MKQIGVGTVDGSCEFVVTGGVRNSVRAQPDSCCKIVWLHGVLCVCAKKEEIDCLAVN